MYEKLEVCPVCKNTNFNNFLICKDHSVSGESFALNQCTKCSLIFTNPRPGQQSLGKYYESEQYISHSNKSNSVVNFIYKQVRNYTIRQKIKLIRKYTRGTSLLDFGCGTGEFLAQCTKSGFKTFGYEPNENASNQATSKGLSIIQNLKDLNQKMDAITAWHVVEHVPTLRDTIKDLKKKLSKDGILFIAVPNVDSFDARHYKEYWAAYDVPRHLYHFSQNSFGKLIAKCKLHLVDTIPMKFDSYYVSLLSEKYLDGKNDFISALRIGYQSNYQAQKNREYSSLIYVLKK